MPSAYGFTNGSYDICHACGSGHGAPKEGAIGMWMGVCAICGKQAGLANAKHDYGLSDEAVAELICLKLSGEVER